MLKYNSLDSVDMNVCRNILQLKQYGAGNTRPITYDVKVYLPPPKHHNLFDLLHNQILK